MRQVDVILRRSFTRPSTALAVIEGLGMRLDWLFTPSTCPLFIYGSCDHIRTVPSLVVTDIGMKEWKLDEGCVETTTLLHCVIWSPCKLHENTHHTHWRVHACVCMKSAGRAQTLAAAVSGSQSCATLLQCFNTVTRIHHDSVPSVPLTL